MWPEINPYDRKHMKALESYFWALQQNPFLPQASTNMAVICHYVRPWF
ncbi:hypothetical protein AMTRI_Chr11g150530 [Amborella trichopoda]